MPEQHRRCLDCGKTYDVLQDLRFPDNPFSSLIPGKELEDLSCYCGSTSHEVVIRSGKGVDLGGEAGATAEYPRWDRGLGCEVKSAQHRRWLMRHHPDGTPRDIPLRPIESSTDDPVGDFYEKKWAAAEKARQKMLEDQERFRYENREHWAKIERYTQELQEAARSGRMPDLRRPR